MDTIVKNEFSASQKIVDRLKSLYSDFNEKKLDELASVYTQDVHFVDPVHEVHGILGLKRYFRGQTGQLLSCKFHYLSEMVGENQAFIRWEMEYAHPKINGGKSLVLPGMSEIHFTNKIFFQQDCYDLGGMLYEHVPVLGFVVKKVKTRIA